MVVAMNTLKQVSLVKRLMSRHTMHISCLINGKVSPQFNCEMKACIMQSEANIDTLIQNVKHVQ